MTKAICHLTGPRLGWTTRYSTNGSPQPSSLACHRPLEGARCRPRHQRALPTARHEGHDHSSCIWKIPARENVPWMIPLSSASGYECTLRSWRVVEDIGYDRIFIYPLALRFDETFDGNTLRGHCHVHTGQSLDWDGDCGSYGLASWMWRAKGGFSILDAVAVSGTNPEAETLLAKIGMDPEAWAAGDWNLVLKWNNSLLEASLQ